MKNKILLGVAISLTIILISVRYVFKKKFEDFRSSVENYESSLLTRYMQEKNNKIVTLPDNDAKVIKLFHDQYSDSGCIIEKDTSLSFLYLNKTIRFKYASLKYIDCLYNKCVIDKHNEEVQNLITEKEKELENKFKEIFSVWYPKFRDEKLIRKIKKSDAGSYYFPDIYELSYDRNAWIEFEKFLTVYDSDQKNAEALKNYFKNKYDREVLNIKKRLDQGYFDYFDNKLASSISSILIEKKTSKVYESPKLGLINYDIVETSFDRKEFQNVADEVLSEQWKYNSLSTGSMPYSNCYGRSNYCNDWSCSEIKVITGGSGDVLVSIKNDNSMVVRHAYIRGGDSFTFNVPDGSYQVFFYSGNGWDPYKEMVSSICGSLKGGFVSNEKVTKDNYITLNSQVMTYELVLQQNGNFNAQTSSTNEAF